MPAFRLCCCHVILAAVCTRRPLPYIVSDASPPRVVISTWSTEVRLTFQFNRWQVEAELDSLILYLFVWCVWPVCKNKEFSSKYLPGLWLQSTEQSSRRLRTYLSFKKNHTHSPLSCSINCCKSIRWKDELWYKTDGTLLPTGGITEGWRSRADECLLIVHERRCGERMESDFSSENGRPHLSKINNKSCIWRRS